MGLRGYLIYHNLDLSCRQKMILEHYRFPDIGKTKQSFVSIVDDQLLDSKYILTNSYPNNNSTKLVPYFCLNTIYNIIDHQKLDTVQVSGCSELC